MVLATECHYMGEKSMLQTKFEKNYRKCSCIKKYFIFAQILGLKGLDISLVKP
jgi:hypothetical protein